MTGDARECKISPRHNLHFQQIVNTCEWPKFAFRFEWIDDYLCCSHGLQIKFSQASPTANDDGQERPTGARP